MSSYKDTVFRFVPEGTGGTFTFSHSQFESSSKPDKGLNHIEYIGTYGCHTCVGIYFKIDQSRACCIHVNGATRAAFPKNIIADGEGEAMKEEFLCRLRKEAEKNDWHTRNDKFGKDLVVVCPNPQFECLNREVYKRTGWHIVQGLREYFATEARKLEEETQDTELTATDVSKKALAAHVEYLKHRSQELTADKDHQGFVVHHPTGKIKLFKVVDKPIDENEIPEDLDGFATRQERSFTNMREGKWIVSELLGNDASESLAEAIAQKNNDQLDQS